MFTFSGCIEMLYPDLPFEKRVAAAKAVGLSAVEFWGWANKNLPALREEAEKSSVAYAGCCVDTVDTAKNEQFNKNKMLDAANAAMYAEIVEESALAVRPLGIRTLITTVGQERFDVTRYAQHDAIIACLSAAEPVARKHGVTLVMEPLNTLVNHMGYYLARSDEALDILRAVNSPHVKLLYDVYHQQITEGNLIDTLRDNIGAIGHVHIADVPGRHEPGSGEINYRNVFRALREAGYSRYVGLEYQPQGATDDTLKALYVIAEMQG